jgi:hypothetical protein
LPSFEERKKETNNCVLEPIVLPSLLKKGRSDPAVLLCLLFSLSFALLLLVRGTKAAFSLAYYPA